MSNADQENRRRLTSREPDIHRATSRNPRYPSIPAQTPSPMADRGVIARKSRFMQTLLKSSPLQRGLRCISGSEFAGMTGLFQTFGTEKKRSHRTTLRQALTSQQACNLNIVTLHPSLMTFFYFFTFMSRYQIFTLLSIQSVQPRLCTSNHIRPNPTRKRGRFIQRRRIRH